MKGGQKSPARTVVSVAVLSQVWDRIDRRVLDVDAICSQALAAAADVLDSAKVHPGPDPTE